MYIGKKLSIILHAFAASAGDPGGKATSNIIIITLLRPSRWLEHRHPRFVIENLYSNTIALPT